MSCGIIDCFFFFLSSRRRHTSLVSDWSSDVCSSDLAGVREHALIAAIAGAVERREGSRVVRWIGDDAAVVRAGAFAATSVDVMVEGTHFRLGDPEDAGWR